MESVINVINKVDTTGFTFLMPSVAVGNVGQLTIDLLISSFHFNKYGTVWHPAIVPAVSGDPFVNNSTNTSIACELFINEELRIIAMQLRSAIEDKLAISFFRKLKLDIAKLGCKQILILTSAFAHERHNITSSPFRYISNDQPITDKLNACDVLPIDEASIFGGGFATMLYSILQDSFECSLLMKYSSEGDNRPDALLSLQLLTRLLNNLEMVSNSEIVYPSSWKDIFGNSPPINIY